MISITDFPDYEIIQESLLIIALRQLALENLIHSTKLVFNLYAYILARKKIKEVKTNKPLCPSNIPVWTKKGF